MITALRGAIPSWERARSVCGCPTGGALPANSRWQIVVTIRPKSQTRPTSDLCLRAIFVVSPSRSPSGIAWIVYSVCVCVFFFCSIQTTHAYLN